MSNPQQPGQGTGYGQQPQQQGSGYQQQPGNNYAQQGGHYAPPPGGYPPQQAGYQPQQVYGQPQYGTGQGNGALAMPKASFGQRFVSYLIDGIIMAILYYIPVVIFGIIGAQGVTVDQTTGQLTSAGNLGLVFVGLLVGLVLAIGYLIFMVAKGQTLGNKVAGMKIVDALGNAPGGGKAFLRAIVQAFLSGWFLIGYLWMLWDPNQQTLHDKLAGTFGVSAR